MCGIFGYVGNKNEAADIVLEGLKLLEYRGYDSWGVAVKVGKKLSVDKHVGKIGDATVNLPQSVLGIGHTRWATHGGVTVANAHPHMDCTKTIAVVHNGIVENFQELKADLIKKGHRFISETDTEIIPHLIEENLKKEGFASSVRDAFNSLKGLNAIVVAYAPSKEIVVAKNGSPLIVGVGENEFFVASDIVSILKHTRNIIFLKDNEMAILGRNIQLISLPKGQKLKAELQKISWKFETASKGKFADFMIKEIFEQPNVIRNIAANYSEQINTLVNMIKKARGTFFIGAGTAFHAALAGTYLFSKVAKKHVNTAVASEFNYLEDFLTKQSLVIALSQSGETIDVIEPLNRAKTKGCKIVAISNTLGSTIYRMADYNILLNAGAEKAVASTKAYTAKLCVMLMLAYGLVGELKVIKSILLSAAHEADRILADKSISKIKELAKFLSKSKNIYAIGRGISYPSALEAALKIKEVSYIPTEGLAGGELKHGTLALFEENTPCIVFAPKDETYESVISNAIEIHSRGGTIIGISPENSPIFDYWIEIKDIDVGSYLVQIIAVQLLAYYIAVSLGLDPDKPRNLAKSVTVK